MLCRSRQRTTNYGAKDGMSCVLDSVRIYLPQSRACRPRDRQESVGLCNVAGICDLRKHTLHDANVAIECTIKTPTEGEISIQTRKKLVERLHT